MITPIAILLAFLPVQPSVQGVGHRQDVVKVVEAAHAATHSLMVVTKIPVDGDGHYLYAELRFYGADYVGLDFSHGSPGIDWRGYYVRSQVYLKQDQCTAVWPGMHAFEQYKVDAVHPRISEQMWFKASGYWPDRAKLNAPRDLGGSLSLLDALRDKRYKLERKTVSVLGAPCWLLQLEGVDRMWLDTECGFAIRRREWLMDGMLRLRAEAKELTDLGDGLWLPKSALVTRFPKAAANTSEAETFHVTTLELTRNNVQESDFQFTPRPGDLLMDREVKGEFRQFVPGGLHILERVATYFERSRVRRSGASFSWGLVGGLSIAIWGLAWFAPGFRRSGRRRR